MSISVRFVHWWPGFEPESSFICALIESATNHKMDIVTDKRAKVDLEVHSVFTRPKCLTQRFRRYVRARQDWMESVAWRQSRDYGIETQGPAYRHIWYTGENLRPPSGWDVTLSFDTESFGGSNYYLPHWAIRTGALNGTREQDMMSVGIDSFLAQRTIRSLPPKFACVLASNPHPMREHMVRALNEVGPVDTFGRAYGRPIESKRKLLAEYRFCITPENDLYPGYVTEKPFEAWLGETIPIWWGIDSQEFLQTSALINVATSSLTRSIETVGNLDANPTEWMEVANRPLLQKSYDYEALIRFVAGRLR